jgi:hypothetical protein
VSRETAGERPAACFCTGRRVALDASIVKWYYQQHSKALGSAFNTTCLDHG